MSKKDNEVRAPPKRTGKGHEWYISNDRKGGHRPQRKRFAKEVYQQLMFWRKGDFLCSEKHFLMVDMRRVYTYHTFPDEAFEHWFNMVNGYHVYGLTIVVTENYVALI